MEEQEGVRVGGEGALDGAGRAPGRDAGRAPKLAGPGPLAPELEERLPFRIGHAHLLAFRAGDQQTAARVRGQVAVAGISEVLAEPAQIAVAAILADQRADVRVEDRAAPRQGRSLRWALPASGPRPSG